MTARKRLPSEAEITTAGRLAIQIMKDAKAEGLSIGGVDIRADGVSLLPLGESSKGNAFDGWKASKD
ncbi:MAG: hypothetical protein AAFY42_09710 [Pseudomonadota bacterium]